VFCFGFRHAAESDRTEGLNAVRALLDAKQLGVGQAISAISAAEAKHALVVVKAGQWNL
jgi:hypothetical protein